MPSRGPGSRLVLDPEFTDRRYSEKLELAQLPAPSSKWTVGSAHGRMLCHVVYARRKWLSSTSRKTGSSRGFHGRPVGIDAAVAGTAQAHRPRGLAVDRSARHGVGEHWQRSLAATRRGAAASIGTPGLAGFSGGLPVRRAVAPRFAGNPSTPEPGQSNRVPAGAAGALAHRRPTADEKPRRGAGYSASPGKTSAFEMRATTSPGTSSLLLRRPLPTTTTGALATASSTSTGHWSGTPNGVIPP